MAESFVFPDIRKRCPQVAPTSRLDACPPLSTVIDRNLGELGTAFQVARPGGSAPATPRYSGALPDSEYARVLAVAQCAPAVARSRSMSKAPVGTLMARCDAVPPGRLKSSRSSPLAPSSVKARSPSMIHPQPAPHREARAGSLVLPDPRRDARVGVERVDDGARGRPSSPSTLVPATPSNIVLTLTSVLGEFFLGRRSRRKGAP